MHNCIFRCAMKAPRPPIPEIRARTPQPGVVSIHLLRSQVEHDLPTFNSVLHRDFSLYPLAVLLSGASNLLLRQSKNCPVSFSAVPCSRREPTLAIVPLTTTEACQSIRVCPSSTAVSLISPDKSTALPGALPLPFIVICSGSSISGRVTSSVNFAFTAPTPTPTTAFQCSSSNTSRL